MDNEIENKENLLTEQEIWDIVQFARGVSGGVYPGILTPDLINARMKDVTLNPYGATQDMLADALQNPKTNEEKLQAFSEDFELQSQPYKRLISYLGSMLSWDYTYTSTNASFDDYKTPKYKKDLMVVNSFFDKLNVQKEFSWIVRQLLRNEAVFVCPRIDEERIVLQELPSNYCKITGRWDYGLLFSFNMNWFLLAGVDINMYPSFFKQKFNEVYRQGSTGSYKPSILPEDRGNSTWVYWVDVPVDVGWCFKMTPEIAARVPYFAPLFNDLVLQSLMRNLQKNINMSAASRILIGSVPMLNKDTKAAVKDSLAINPELLGKFLYLVKSAIAESIKVTSVPLNDIQGVSFPAENDMYDTFLRTALASSGVNSNLIFSSNIKPNAIETQLSLNVDEQLMYTLYPQFNDFCDYHINKTTKHYKFAVEFEGTRFYTNRAERLETQTNLITHGIVMPQKIAAAIGMKPHVFQKQLDEARANNWIDDLTPIINSSNMSKDLQKGAGRPRKSDSDISESGSQTRENAGNIGRGGKI